MWLCPRCLHSYVRGYMGLILHLRGPPFFSHRSFRESTVWALEPPLGITSHHYLLLGLPSLSFIESAVIAFSVGSFLSNHPPFHVRVIFLSKKSNHATTLLDNSLRILLSSGQSLLQDLASTLYSNNCKF